MEALSGWMVGLEWWCDGCGGQHGKLVAIARVGAANRIWKSCMHNNKCLMLTLSLFAAAAAATNRFFLHAFVSRGKQ